MLIAFSHQNGKRERVRRPALWLVLMMLLAYAYTIPRGGLANADSHIALTRAIVDDHTLRIDPYAAGLADRSAYKGHFYTDKAPGLSLLAVPAYALLRLLLPRAFFAPDLFFVARYLLTALVVGLPAALFVGLLFVFLTPLIGRSRAALLACGYGLGTMAWALSALLFSHIVAAMATFGAFMLLYQVSAGRRSPAPWRWALAGGLCGLAVLCEYPAALVAAGVAVFAAHAAYRARAATGSAAPSASTGGAAPSVSTGSAGILPAPVGGEWVGASEYSDRARGLAARQPGLMNYRPAICPLGPLTRIALFVAAALALLMPLAAYNVAIYGSPFSQGYAHLHGAREFVAGMGHGVEGLGAPSLGALWGITFSPYRGLFVLSPFLLLAFPGLVAMWRRRADRPAALLCAYAAGALLLFNGGYYFWDGGVSLGPRHFAPALPFLLFPVAFALRRARWYRAGRALIILSIGIVALCCVTVVIFLPGVPDPILTLALPRLLHGPTPNNWGLLLGLRGPASLLPLAVCEGVLTATLWRALRSTKRRYADDHANSVATGSKKPGMTGSPTRSSSAVSK